jgi:hypothetical protein
MAAVAMETAKMLKKNKNTKMTKFRLNQRIFVFGGHFVPWLPWQWPPFRIFFNPPKSCHTLRWIFLQIFMKFDETQK